MQHEEPEVRQRSAKIVFRLYNSRTKQQHTTNIRKNQKNLNAVKEKKTPKTKELSSYMSNIESKADHEAHSSHSILRRTHFSQDFLMNMSKQTELTRLIFIFIEFLHNLGMSKKGLLILVRID